MECQSHASYFPTLHGFWAQFSKTPFAANYMNRPEFHRNQMAKDIVSYHYKQIFDGKCFKYTELHEFRVFLFPTSPQRVGSGVQYTK